MRRGGFWGVMGSGVGSAEGEMDAGVGCGVGEGNITAGKQLLGHDVGWEDMRSDRVGSH